MEVTTHVSADKDDFQNTIRQKLGKELSEALWREDTSGQPLTKLERLTKTVKPAYEESWNTQERDIQPEAKKDAVLQNSQVEDQESPSDEYVSCHQPVGQHLLKCSRYTLQQDPTEAVHKIHVEPLKAPPKVVHPFPRGSTQFQLMPPPIVPVKFAVRLNKATKMKTDLLSTETRMLTATTTHHVTTHKLSPEEIQSLTSSFWTPMLILKKKKKLYQTGKRKSSTPS